MIVIAYLSWVKSIYANEAALDDIGFFIDFHPDSFGETHKENIQCLEKVMELKNTWHKSSFKIKELDMNQTAFCSNSFHELLLSNHLWKLMHRKDRRFRILLQSDTLKILWGYY